MNTKWKLEAKERAIQSGHPLVIISSMRGAGGKSAQIAAWAESQQFDTGRSHDIYVVDQDGDPMAMDGDGRWVLRHHHRRWHASEPTMPFYK